MHAREGKGAGEELGAALGGGWGGWGVMVVLPVQMLSALALQPHAFQFSHKLS